MKNLLQKSKKTSLLKNKAIDFIAAGVGCNCLVGLHEIGALEGLVKTGTIYESQLNDYGDPLAIRSALITLEKCKVLTKAGGCFDITEFGRVLVDYLGLITIFFSGYGPLVGNQVQIMKKRKVDHEKLIHRSTVAKSSTSISEKMINPLIIQEFYKLNAWGTICDLGCGHGTMLSEICKKTGNPGLGFESDQRVVNEANQQSNARVVIEVEDIKALHGVWEDVIFLMQAFVFHDFNPGATCIRIMDAYLENFPNLRYFFYIDIVSPSAAKKHLFPGFDYVHGLLGVPTRTYEETLSMFCQSSYTIFKEVPISDLPNTFLWILSSKRETIV